MHRYTTGSGSRCRLLVEPTGRYRSSTLKATFARRQH